MKRYAAALISQTFLLMLLFAQPAMAVLAPGSVPLFHLRFRVTGAAQSSPKPIVLAMDKDFRATSANGDWSQWQAFGPLQVTEALVRYPNLYLKRFPLIVKFNMSKLPDASSVELEIRLDETGKLITTHAQLQGAVLGLALWRDAGNKPLAGTLADYNRQMIWDAVPAVADGKAASPRNLPIIDRFIGGSDDAIEWKQGIGHLASYGANTMVFAGPDASRAIMSAAGISRVAGAVYSPPGYTFAFPYYNRVPKGAAASMSGDQLLDTWASALTKPYVTAGYDLKDVAVYHVSDEPGWYYPRAIDDLKASASGMVRFHNYLQAQHLRPADLGAASWQQVQPIGVSEATSPAQRKLFYWTMQFFPWDSANYFASATRALDKAFYPGIPDPVNWNFFSARSYVPGPVANNPAKTSPDAAMGGHDWFEFAKLHGSNMLWTEDWFADSEAYDWSFYAAKLGSAARESGIQWGGYVVPRSSGGTPHGLMQKVLSVFGNGGKAVEYFVFGPEYNFPGNCYSPTADVLLPQMAQVAGMLAKADGLLQPGRKPQSQVAILQPRSSEVWDSNGISDATNTNLNSHTVDYMAEIYDLYRGLQQQNIPTDFVAEDDLSLAGLKNYRVLFVTEPDFPQDQIPGLMQWVRQGGILVSVSGALAADRYDAPMPAFQQARGIVEAPRKRQMVLSTSLLTAVDSLDDGLPVYGARGSIHKTQGTVLAHFRDGTPAIVEHKLERGAFIHFAFLPGVSAYAALPKKSALLPTGLLHALMPGTSAVAQEQKPSMYSATALKWIAYPVRLADVQPPVTVDQLDVETPMLLSDRGAVITLLNWRGMDVPRLHVTARAPFRVRTVESVTAGKLPFTRDGNMISFFMPLAGADIVMLEK
jgi:hypothetical protein